MCTLHNYFLVQRSSPLTYTLNLLCNNARACPNFHMISSCARLQGCICFGMFVLGHNFTFVYVCASMCFRSSHMCACRLPWPPLCLVYAWCWWSVRWPRLVVAPKCWNLNGTYLQRVTCKMFILRPTEAIELYRVGSSRTPYTPRREQVLFYLFSAHLTPYSSIYFSSFSWSLFRFTSVTRSVTNRPIAALLLLSTR